MQAGTLTVLSTEELSKLKCEKNEAIISILKTPEFWKWCDNSRATYLRGEEKQKKWTHGRASTYDTDCNLN